MMPFPTAADGILVSAPTFTDQKAFNKHLANGTTQIPGSRSDISKAPSRQSSEPLSSPAELFSLNAASVSSRDDAYHIFDGKALGKDNANTIGASQASSYPIDPRQLLDPKGFKSVQLKKNSDNTTEPDLSFGLQKRSLEDGKGQGLGNLIERVHNVTQREDRPQKRQKSEQTEGENEEKKKIAIAGGGKGGEIGEYMKQKRREGHTSVESRAIVDLTRSK